MVPVLLHVSVIDSSAPWIINLGGSKVRSKQLEDELCHLRRRQLAHATSVVALMIVDSKEDCIQCEGQCRLLFHRYCAGVSVTHYKQFISTGRPSHHREFEHSGKISVLNQDQCHSIRSLKISISPFYYLLPTGSTNNYASLLSTILNPLVLSSLIFIFIPRTALLLWVTSGSKPKKKTEIDYPVTLCSRTFIIATCMTLNG